MQAIVLHSFPAFNFPNPLTFPGPRLLGAEGSLGKLFFLLSFALFSSSNVENGINRFFGKRINVVGEG